MNEIENIVKSIGDLSTKLANETATKTEVAKLGDALKAFENQFAQFQVESEQRKQKALVHPVFGNMDLAKQMVDALQEITSRSTKNAAVKGMPLYTEKATLNVTTAGQGGYLIPTELSNVLLELVTKGGRARGFHRVYDNLVGPIDLPKGTSEAAAAFVADDTTALAETDKAFTKVTLNPKQVGAIFRASNKLIRNSVLAIATIVANEMTRAAGRLEDNAVLVGDGTATYGSITGYKNATVNTSTNVAALANLTIDHLIDLQTQVHEEIDPENAAYYMGRETIAAIKKLKDTTNRYLVDLQSPTPNINGVPVICWKRMANPTASGALVALYGDLKQAGAIGIGREVAIAASEHVDFTKGGMVWRLLYDFDFLVTQSGAVARIKIT